MPEVLEDWSQAKGRHHSDAPHPARNAKSTRASAALPFLGENAMSNDTRSSKPGVYKDTVTVIEREATGYREDRKTYSFDELKELFDGSSDLVRPLIEEIERLRKLMLDQTMLNTKMWNAGYMAGRDAHEPSALLHEIYDDMLDVLASGRPTGSTDLLSDRLKAYLDGASQPPTVIPALTALLREARPYLESFASLTKHPTAGADALDLAARIRNRVLAPTKSGSFQSAVAEYREARAEFEQAKTSGTAPAQVSGTAEAGHPVETGGAQCEGRYPVPQTSPPREEGTEITYRCHLRAGHAGPCGTESEDVTP